MNSKNKKLVSFLAALSIIEGIGIFTWLVILPSEGNFFMGFSISRVILIFMPLIYACCGFFILFSKTKKGFFWEEYLESYIKIYNNHRFFHTLLLSLIAILFLLILTPDYRFGDFHYYAARIRPIITLLLCLLKTILIFFTIRNKATIKSPLNFPYIALCVGIFFLFILTKVLGLGWVPDSSFWNEPGIPFLLSDIIFIIVGLFLILGLNEKGFLEKKISSIKIIDLLIGCSLCILTAIIWLSVPAYETPLMTSPYPPAYDYYPLQDAQLYDLDSLSLINGSTLGIGGIADKPLYSLFLAFLHSIQPNANYYQIGNSQIIIFSSVSLFLYLLGSSLDSRITGIIFTVLAMFYGKNLLASTWIVLSANPRILTTGFPSLIILSIIALILIRFLYNSDQMYWLILLGGILGLSTLLRYNFWMLIPFCLSIIIFSKAKRKFLATSLTLFLVILTILPWQIRSQKVIGTSTYFLDRFINVVWAGRYNNQEIEIIYPIGNEVLDTNFVKFQWSSLINGNNYLLNIINNENNSISAIDLSARSTCNNNICVYETQLEPGTYEWMIEGYDQVGTKTISIKENFTIPDNKYNHLSVKPQIGVFLFHHLNNNRQIKKSALNELWGGVQPFINHTAHNIISPLFSFPLTLINHDLYHLMYKNQSVWWIGIENLTVWQWTGLLINMAFCVKGFLIIKERSGNIALVPLGLYFAYSLGLGLARTSGGRYIVPLTIIPLLYWTSGIKDLLAKFFFGTTSQLIFNKRKDKLKTLLTYDIFINKSRKIILAIIVILIPALSLVIFEKKPSEIISLNERQSMSRKIMEIDFEKFDLDIINDDLVAFIQKHPQGQKFGKLYYPIYLDQYQHTGWTEPIYQPRDYGRLTFTTLNKFTKNYAQLQISTIPDIVNGVEIAYFSCPKDDYDDILVLFLFDQGEIQDVLIKDSLSIPFDCIQSEE